MESLLYDIQQKIIDLIRIINNKNEGLKHYNLFKYLFIISSVLSLILSIILLAVIWHQLFDLKSLEVYGRQDKNQFPQ